MDRRTFIGSAAGGATAAGLAAPALGQSTPRVQWRCASSFPKSLDTIYGGAEDVATYVREATDGAFDIQVFASGEIVPGLQVADAVADGTVEMCHTASYYFVGKDPTWALGCAIPYGLDARGMHAWVYYGGGLDLLNAYFNRQGLHLVPAGNVGAQMGGWFNTEINGMSDMEGLQMRISGLAGRVMNRVGVVPQQIAAADIYSALERGSLDAAEWIGPYDDEKLGFQEVAPYYYYPNWWEGNALLAAFVNRARWEELPDRYRSLLQTAGRAATVEMLAEYDYKNPQALRRLVGAGAQLRTFPQEVLNATYDATLALYSELSGSNESWAEIYGSMMDFQNEHYLWQQVAEDRFAQFMMTKQQQGELPVQVEGGGTGGGGSGTSD